MGSNRSDGQNPRRYQMRVLTCALILFVATLAACAHVLYAIMHDNTYTWTIFGAWLAGLVSITIVTLWSAWHYRKHLKTWQQLLALDLGGTLLWYWAFAPFYQSLVVDLTNKQTAIDAFAFFWEVPLVGGIAALMSQWQFRGLSKYSQTGVADDPEKLFRQAEALPIQVIVRNCVAATLGFVLGVIQINHFAGISDIEAAKDILLGVVVAIFVSLYYFLVFYSLISPIKSKLITQYDIQDGIRIKYHNRVLIMILLLSSGTLLLATNLYIGNFQKSVATTLSSDASQRLLLLDREDSFIDAQATQQLRYGENGAVYVIDPTDSLPIQDLSRETKQSFTAQESGSLLDYGRVPRLIVFRTVNQDAEDVVSQKVATVVSLRDFYAPMVGVLRSLLIGAVMLIFVITAASLIFVRVLNHTLRKLDVAVRTARKTGRYDASIITTGDEFETISREFGHFVHETQEHSKRLAEEHARLEASLQSLELGMIIIDAHGRIINSNEAVYKVLGLRERDHHTIHQLIKQLPNALKLEQYITRALTHKRPTHAHNVVYGTKYFDIFVAPIITDVDKPIGAVTVVQDITESKMIERSKDEFFSIASHELRTPLTAIRGNTDMIHAFFENELKQNPELKDMLQDIYDSSVRLIGIVNDFLDVSRLEQGKMIFHPSAVSLEHVVEAVAYDMRANIAAKNLSITIDHKTLDKLPPVWADEGRIKQVLYNMIGNAAKFTDKGGISVLCEKHGTFIKVIVRDTGPGIQPDMQKLLFRKFQQASVSLLTRDASRGTGLGLYISRFIVRAMGGQMQLEWSEVGKGSAFSFTVPIATKEHLKQKASVAQVDVVTGITADQQK